MVCTVSRDVPLDVVVLSQYINELSGVIPKYTAVLSGLVPPSPGVGAVLLLQPKPNITAKTNNETKPNLFIRESIIRLKNALIKHP